MAAMRVPDIILVVFHPASLLPLADGLENVSLKAVRPFPAPAE
jgi:hypothetical protein